MQRMTRDSYVALVLLIGCGVFFWDTTHVRDMGYESMGSEVWPRIILLLLAALGIALLVQSLRVGAPQAAPLPRFRNALWCFALFAGFLLTLPFLGMLLGGIAFVFCTLSALGERTARAARLHALIAVATIGTMYAIFTFGLRVMLPQGELLPAW